MFLSNRQLFAMCCLICLFGAIEGAKKDKKKTEEDVYGDLSDDIQKDQVDYGLDEDEDTDDSFQETDSDIPVVGTKILSKSKVFVENVGAVAELPCESSSKDVVKVWSKGDSPIFQGTINVGNNHNYMLLPNGNLKVVLEKPEDFGIYKCKLAISNNVQPEVMYEINQMIHPEITEISADRENRVYNTSDSLTLTCKASGYPKPKVSWYKNNERLGTNGKTLTISPVKPKHSGSYRCLADNSYGRPAHKYIEIFVNHGPIVSVEKYVVNSNHKEDAELVCEVKAYPPPMVMWQKNGEVVKPREPKIQLKYENNNERNILVIKDVQEEDFGRYRCIANNTFGEKHHDINLVKTPVIRKLGKARGPNTARDVLEWRVESAQKISTHELQLRKKGETLWKTFNPDVIDGDNDVYIVKHSLKSLEPGTYEARARSKNEHGWSDYSDIIAFMAGDDGLETTEQRNIEELSAGANTSGSCLTRAFDSAVTLPFLLLLLFNTRT